MHVVLINKVKYIYAVQQIIRLSRIGRMEWWNGTLEWNTGMNNSRLRVYMIIFFVTCAFMLCTRGCVVAVLVLVLVPKCTTMSSSSPLTIDFESPVKLIRSPAIRWVFFYSCFTYSDMALL